MRLQTLCIALFSAISAFGAIHINSLDPAHKVTVGDIASNGTVTISFEGKNYRLDGNNLYLDSELSDANASKSPFIFNNVREALDAMNVGPESTSLKTLLIAPGVYWVDDPDDPAIRQNQGHTTPYGMIIDCPRMSLVGLTANPENVVLACNRGNTQGAVSNFTMLNLISEDIEAQNITFGNYCNVDLDYPLKKEYSRPKREEAFVQAQLVHTNAEKIFVHNCRFISRLNTSPFTGGHRTLFDNCYFECTDDALAGSAVYLHSKFLFFSSKPFYDTEFYGAVLLDCDIDTNIIGRQQYFCKDRGGIVAIDTRIRTLRTDDIQVIFNYSPKVDSWYFSNLTVNGKQKEPMGAIDITDRDILKAFKVEVDGKTVYNIANLMAGNDGWDPLAQRSIIPAEYIGMPVAMVISRPDDARMLDNRDDKSELTLKFYRWGGYEAKEAEVKKVAGDGVTWQETSVASIFPTGNFTADLVPKYRHNVPYFGLISASVASGLQAKSAVAIAPYFNEAPRFEKAPSLTLDVKERSLIVDYLLSMPDSPNATDHSIITWYRYTQPDKSDTIPVMWGTGDSGAVIYKLKNADRDSKILCTVTPRFDDSFLGRTHECSYVQPFNKLLMPALFVNETHYSTDFHNVPVYFQPRREQGAWSFDGFKPADTKAFSWKANPESSWYYGLGQNGMVGQGLVQGARGARCFYIPCREKCSDMKALVRIDPGKTNGQGFGSATAQYLDICIKFDPETLTGYAFRIERVAEYSDACQFSLVKYTNGETQTIGEPVVSNCFISTCTLTIELKGNRLIANATSSGNVRQPSSPKIQTEVHLERTVAKNDFTGFCLQHTGTVGSAASMIHNVELNWK